MLLLTYLHFACMHCCRSPTQYKRSYTHTIYSQPRKQTAVLKLAVESKGKKALGARDPSTVLGSWEEQRHCLYIRRPLGGTVACWISSCQQDAGRQSTTLLVVAQGFVQDTEEEKTHRPYLWVRRWAGLLKGKEHCHFIRTENLCYCTTASTSAETHLNNVNKEWESELIMASFHLTRYHTS